MLRRHPFLSAVALLLLLTVAGIATFIATFDLNRYREQLQARLSTALSQPVHLGTAGFSLRHGPAFSFADLRIGAGEGESGVLQADYLLIKLELLPLLKREVTISAILLEGPHLNLNLDPPAVGEIAPAHAPQLDLGMAMSTLIRSLEISNGTLHLVDRRDADRPFSITLERIEGQISNLSLNQPSRFRLAGIFMQGGTSSPFVLAGEVKIGSAPFIWQDLGLDLELKLEHLEPDPLLERYVSSLARPKTTGSLALALKLSGSPASGWRFEGEIDSKGTELRITDYYQNPLRVQKIRCQGNWSRHEAVQTLTDLSLHIDELGFSGSVTMEQRDGETWFSAELSSGSLPLLDVVRLLPDRIRQDVLQPLRSSLAGGTAEIVAARFNGPLASISRPGADFPLQAAEIRVQNAALRFERGELLRALSFIVRLENDLLAVQAGEGRFLDASFHFAGSLLRPFDASREVELGISGSLPLQPLLAMMPTRWPEELEAEGILPLELKIEGPPAKLILDLSADLQQTALRWKDRPIKPAGSPGNLFLTGKLVDERLELSHSRLQMPPLEMRVSGSVGRAGDHPFDLEIDLAPLPLPEVVPFLPVLERFDLQGTASGRFAFTGGDGKVRKRGGTLYLRDFGMHLGGPLADISDGNGQFLLLDDGVDFEGVSARLGISPVRVDGSLRGFSAPRLELHVTAKTIRADELIFPSDRAVLRNVEGSLVIDGNGILFAPVTLRLNGGTQVSVSGALEGFREPRVTLDIDAQKANIDEVIGLWNRPAQSVREEQAPERKREVLVDIDARVKEGVLGPLNFQNAEGKIGYADGTLTIFPLRFDSGAGRCTAQVTVEKAPDGSPLLKMSGHLENFDTEELHHELLKRRGLITGTLNGDFYLEGEPGKNFLPTSLGGFSLQVKNGVLRKFPFLSKVFSLLNVSQILTLKLPDMAQEGMPFNFLKGNISLVNGILATDDLFVDSNAMNLSLVGKSNLAEQKLDMVLGVKPLRTVDKIVTRIPIAGWVLTGEGKALITAHFEIKGKSDDPDVTAIPVASVSEQVMGIFRRVLGLPGKVVDDVGGLLHGEK